MKTDFKGRITELENGDNCHSGHSVCNNCGKDMPGCWEVVCNSCKKTLCYKCSIDVLGFWHCKKGCQPKPKIQLLTRFQILKQE